MKPGTFIKHKNHRDIGYKILSVKPEIDGTRVTFEYWNLRGMSVPYKIVAQPREFFLFRFDEDQWEVVEID